VSQNLVLSGIDLQTTFTASTSMQDTSQGWLLVSPPAITGPGSFSVAIDPTQLAAGAHLGAVTIAGPNFSQQVPITVTAYAALSVTPAILAFSYQAGGTAPAGQILTVTNAGATANFAMATGGAASGWLTVNPSSGVTPSTVTVSANPAGLAAGTYSGTINVTPRSFSGVAQTIPVTLTVSGAAVITASPSSFQVNYQVGDPNPTPPSFAVSGVAGQFTASALSSGNWLSVGPLSGTLPATLSAQISPAGLSPGLYTGAIQVVTTGLAMATVTISLNVYGAQSLTLSPSTLAFTYQSGSAAPASQVITVGCPNSALAFRPAASSVGAWLSVSVPSAQNNNVIIVSVNPVGLSANTYQGAVSIYGVGACPSVQTVPVTLTVSAAGALTAPVTASTLTFTPAALAFSATAGGAAPAPQLVAIACAGSVALFTATATSNQSWLSVSPASGYTPGTITVSANPAGLAAGSYTGSISVTAGSCGAAPALTVILNVAPGSASSTVPAITPAALAFGYQAGGVNPANQTVSLSGAAGAAFTTAVSSGWLSVNPSSGAAPATLTVAVNPAGLSAGTYSGIIGISTNSGTGGFTQNVPVTLTVSAAAAPSQAATPLPTVSLPLNGGSLQVTPVAPGEIISIFGQGLGPAAGANLSLTPDGLVANALSGTRVLFDGSPGPLLYAQSGQINAVAPYSISGSQTVQVVVEFQGVDSTPSTMLVAPAAPAIFTMDQSGHGQGAILNQDTSVNSDLNPADRGSIVTLFASGAGLLVPAAQDGAVTTDLATAMLPVAVLVDGQNPEITYAGAAPGLVSGVLQVNFRLPSQAMTGKIGVLLKVGRFTSQSGVTMAIR
jgi:uncharacterized protein (TIGR03437 family)